MNKQENTVKSSLIEANELIKEVLSDKSKLSPRELAEKVGQKLWLAAEILGIELDWVFRHLVFDYILTLK